jgi:hypothetical protein
MACDAVNNSERFKYFLCCETLFVYKKLLAVKSLVASLSNAECILVLVLVIVQHYI